jgi:hypothetical protein
MLNDLNVGDQIMEFIADVPVYATYVRSITDKGIIVTGTRRTYYSNGAATGSSKMKIYKYDPTITENAEAFRLCQAIKKDMELITNMLNKVSYLAVDVRLLRMAAYCLKQITNLILH